MKNREMKKGLIAAVAVLAAVAVRADAPDVVHAKDYGFNASNATEAEIFDQETVNGRAASCRAALTPLAGKDVWGAWRLTLTDGQKVKTTCVSDFASAADFESWRNAFSIWF